MLKTTLQKKQRGLASWKTRDLLVTAVIGIVFALVMAGTMNLSTLLMAVLSPPVALMLAMPFSVLTGIMALYIVRRPGAALLSEFVTGLVMTPLTAFGFTRLLGDSWRACSTRSRSW
jgi:energy-coupling factor transport system substrate-specific component